MNKENILHLADMIEQHTEVPFEMWNFHNCILGFYKQFVDLQTTTYSLYKIQFHIFPEYIDVLKSELLCSILMPLDWDDKAYAQLLYTRKNTVRMLRDFVQTGVVAY